MPYGTIMDMTRKHLLARAAQENISPEKLGLDPVIPDPDSVEFSIPADFPVQPVRIAVGLPRPETLATCDECGLHWDDTVPTEYTPVPSGRCPFEAFHVSTPDNLYEVSVIFGGALDESFYVQTDYEVNIADWIAEVCREESAKQDGEDWEVIVSEYAWEDAGAIRYRVSSWDEVPDEADDTDEANLFSQIVDMVERYVRLVEPHEKPVLGLISTAEAIVENVAPRLNSDLDTHRLRARLSLDF